MTTQYMSFIVEDHSKDGLRAGEGSIVNLKDGRLLMLYSRFSGGGGDGDPAVIARRTSGDGGRTWSEPRVEFSVPPGALNVMSVSLLRMSDGRIGCLHGIKWNQERFTPVFHVSDDEGDTWSKPVPVSTEKDYFCVNNDRLIQLRDGTLAFPYARCARDSNSHFEERGNMPCGLFYSRDHGATWHRSPHEIRHTPEVFAPPLFVNVSALDETLRQQFDRKYNIFQEPGLVELEGGGLMMFMRSVWCIYRCFARDCTAPWEECGPIEGFNVCCGPQTVRREPLSGNLVMFYNDRGEIPWATPGFSNRTPLSVAVSTDDGRSWRRLGRLESDRKNYCYYSLLFLEDRFITSFYESGVYGDRPEAKGKRRNLASLKVGIGDTALFSTPFGEPGSQR